MNELSVSIARKKFDMETIKMASKPKKKYIVHRGFDYPEGKALRDRLNKGKATEADIKNWVRQDATDKGVSVPSDLVAGLLERKVIEEA